MREKLYAALFLGVVCACARGMMDPVFNPNKQLPYVGRIFPTQGPKEGGTLVRVEGRGFVENTDLTCRFTRNNPLLKTPIDKMVPASYVSPTTVLCESPAWDEDDCPNCENVALDGTVSGHSGSRYLRSTSTTLTKNLGVGSFIKFAGGTTGHGSTLAPLMQTFQVQKVEACSGVGCVCSGGTWQETPYNSTQGFNAAGEETSYATVSNNAMYVYDALRNAPGSTKPTPVCVGGTWTSGTKLVLSEHVYKVPGTPNVAFSGKPATRSFVDQGCTSCKCGNGCVVTISVANDGKQYSGQGVDGEVWTGSAGSFSFKDVTPTVYYITTAIAGYWDSTRVSGPAKGGTTIYVHGKDFQNSPRLECYFQFPRPEYFRATFINETCVQCITPQYLHQERSVYASAVGSGAMSNPFIKVQITNSGKPGDGGLALSQNPFIADDGSFAYMRTMHAGSWEVEEYPSGNPFRSTCRSGVAPNYQLPCRGAHVAGQSEGNDVGFRYSACYDFTPATMKYERVSGTDQAIVLLTSVLTAVGERFTIPDYDPLMSNTAGIGGPMSYVTLWFTKASAAGVILEFSIAASQFSAQGGTVLMKERIHMFEAILETNPTPYKIFFSNQVYLKPGVQYFAELKWVSGAEDVKWVNTDADNTARNTVTDQLLGAGRFKIRLSGCDGCETQYAFDPSAPATTAKVGTMAGASLQRSQLAQAFTTKDKHTSLTHAYLKLSTGGSNARVMVWLTKYGKHGENVCTSLGTPATLLSTCDVDRDGVFNELCQLGAACNPTNKPNGGCGGNFRGESGTGTCGEVPTLANGHFLTETPTHSKLLTNVDGWTVFEFLHPVSVDRYTTYYLTLGVVGSTETSAETVWYSGNRASTPAADTSLGTAFARAPGTWVWSQLPNCGVGAGAGICALAVKFTSCSTHLPGILSMSTPGYNGQSAISKGHRPGCCDFRVSPRGGDEAVVLNITGRNIVPSNKLACVFTDENNAPKKFMPATIVSQAGDVSVVQCTSPEFDPHAGKDCSVATNCQGTAVYVTNDGVIIPDQVQRPKWDANGVPKFHATNVLHKILFSDLYVDAGTAGSDTSGDGSRSRPYKSLQRALDMANPVDRIYVLPGIYTCTSNKRGLRSYGKRVSMQVLVEGSSEATDTLIKCQALNPELSWNTIVHFAGYAASNMAEQLIPPSSPL